jgi:hypothetical protein
MMRGLGSLMLQPNLSAVRDALQNPPSYYFLIVQLDAAGSWKNYPNIDKFYAGIWKMSQDNLQNSP